MSARRKTLVRRLYGDAPKRYVLGTQRVLAPVRTVERLTPLLAAFGITRVANLTGLDTVGLPVVLVHRPNARSLAVAQGKGLDLASAKASGIMESIEQYHAERPTLPLRLATYRELAHEARVVDPASLPSTTVSTYREQKRLLWVQAQELLGGEPSFIPYEVVHLDLTRPLPEGSGCFPVSSSGLASGNHPLEAVIHGLCELIERDAYALWLSLSEPLQAATRIDPSGIRDPACREVIARFEQAGLMVGIWEISAPDLRVPAFKATIVARDPACARALFPSVGLGCHLVREVALLRALTEAAQSRLTRIAGSRDDIAPSDYRALRNPDYLAGIRASIAAPGPLRAWAGVPTRRSTGGLLADLEWLLQRVRRAGLQQVFAVDLSRPGLPVHVVRVVVPGLEVKPGSPGYVPGARLRAYRAERA